jgi:hypothetical protein
MANLPSDERATQIKEIFDRWEDARKDWDVHAREDIDFYLGNHFSKDESEVLAEREAKQAQAQQMQEMQQLQQVAKAGGDIAPLAKALPQDAQAIAEGVGEQLTE